jgi:metallo-beta-lactamase family protein
MTTIRFMGAAGTVTGSRFLVEHDGVRVLVDCGLFQGLKELRLRNWKPLPVDPSSIDAVVLTHAHLDHCGYLPRLVKDGFRGKVYATRYTSKLAEVIMLDSARIQMEDAAFAAKKGFSKHNPPEALYNEHDANQAVTKFVDIEYGEPTQVAKGAVVTLHNAGHILGAATITLEMGGKRMLFSGDLGRNEHPLLAPPEPVPSGHFDAIISESTYGDREHVEPSAALADVIKQTIARGGSILIPAFAVDRTEVLLVRLRELVEAGEIPPIPIYADSPMALKALAFYRAAINEGSAEVRPEVSAEWKGRDPFDPGTLTELFSVEESKTVNDPTASCIIVSASGMATGGRVVHHLRQMLPNPKHTVIMVGYQAMGTRGRSLVDGAEFVKMHGEFVPVKAQVERIDEFSVHADANELVQWLGGASEAPGQILLVHGEAGAAETLALTVKDRLGWRVHVPTDGEIVTI